MSPKKSLGNVKHLLCISLGMPSLNGLVHYRLNCNVYPSVLFTATKIFRGTENIEHSLPTGLH